MATKKTAPRDVTFWTRQHAEGITETPTKDDLATLQDAMLTAKRAVIEKDAELSRLSNALSDAREELQRIERVYSSVEDAFLRGT